MKPFAALIGAERSTAISCDFRCMGSVWHN
jgi:hypothetical protein